MYWLAFYLPLMLFNAIILLRRRRRLPLSTGLSNSAAIGLMVSAWLVPAVGQPWFGWAATAAAALTHALLLFDLEAPATPR